ncbi:MAG: helix-turn-helix domain-containing protein [Geminicoccaceae bacterium]
MPREGCRGRLLETAETSFTARVTELRLQRAFALLSETPTRWISDIALEASLSDISHFNRLFRARFGDTPSALRAQRFASEQPKVLNLLPPEPGVRAGAI